MNHKLLSDHIFQAGYPTLRGENGAYALGMHDADGVDSTLNYVHTSKEDALWVAQRIAIRNTKNGECHIAFFTVYHRPDDGPTTFEAYDASNLDEPIDNGMVQEEKAK